MTPKQMEEIDLMISYLEAKVKTSRGDKLIRARVAWDSLTTLKREHESLRQFKLSVDEALNSGDGVYRP